MKNSLLLFLCLLSSFSIEKGKTDERSYLEIVKRYKINSENKYTDTCPAGKKPNNSLVCMAGIGKDKFGKEKISGWSYFSPEGLDWIQYFDIEPYKVNVNGTYGRYISLTKITHKYKKPTAGVSGYSYQTGPTRTDCYDNRNITENSGYGSPSSSIGGSITCKTDQRNIKNVPGRGSTEAYVEVIRADHILDCKRGRFSTIHDLNKYRVVTKWSPLSEVDKAGWTDIVELTFSKACKEINQLSNSMVYSFIDSDSELTELN